MIPCSLLLQENVAVNCRSRRERGDNCS
uniref:Uncharacterized protein n=1 Tax=Rhizophora mucronata TaxID=61149 RepID=A0A2P2MME9_RHIMU